MPEENGEAMVCHLKSANADVGDVFKKVVIIRIINLIGYFLIKINE